MDTKKNTIKLIHQTERHGVGIWVDEAGEPASDTVVVCQVADGKPHKIVQEYRPVAKTDTTRIMNITRKHCDFLDALTEAPKYDEGGVKESLKELMG
jgi:hypothetical protein